jgi:hypothetical protein
MSCTPQSDSLQLFERRCSAAYESRTATRLMHGSAMPDANGRISKVCKGREYTAPFILCISAILDGASWLS